DLHLRLAVLRGRLRFVQTLQRAVVPFVEAPALLDRNPQTVEAVERDVERAEGARQQRGVGDVEIVLAFAQQSSSLSGLVAPLVPQVDVGPAGEPVLLVPRALAVTEQNDFGHKAARGRGCALPDLQMPDGGAAGVLCPRSELLFDAEQLVVLAGPIGAARRSCLDLAGGPSDGEGRHRLFLRPARS